MRKDTLKPTGYKLLDSVPTITSITSDTVYVPFLDNVGIQVSWSGSIAAEGTLFVDVSNQQENPNEAQQWSTLDFGSTITIDDTAGDHLININQLPYNALRVRYVAIDHSSDCLLTVIIQAKMI